MEDLTKTQIVMLSLLVSFVTSIGTGIIASSLLNNASVGVTQTVNRVVERTIEKVVPGPSGTTKEVKVVIKEEDLIMSAIEKTSKSLVRIKNSASADSAETFQALGLVMNKDGLIATDKKNFVQGGSYQVVMGDGTIFPASVVSINDASGIAFLKVSLGDKKYTFVPVTIGNSDNLKLGQTIISIGGKDRNSVSIGNISDLSYSDSATNGGKTVTSIETQIALKDGADGGPLLNIDGDIVGIKLEGTDVKSGVYMPINALKNLTSALSSGN